MPVIPILAAVQVAAATPAAPTPQAATPGGTARPPGPVAAAAPRPSRVAVLAAVRREWPRYDPAGAGRLTPLAFSTWVLQANGAVVAPRTGARGIKPVTAMNATARAFARADANHDGGVTPEEMTDFLLR